jgi:thiol-disulfide isomerase/thioredoxin
MISGCKNSVTSFFYCADVSNNRFSSHFQEQYTMYRGIPLLFILVISLAACGTTLPESASVPGNQTVDADSLATPADDMMATDDATPTLASRTDDADGPQADASADAGSQADPVTEQPVTAAYNAPEWATLPVTNAITGETFTLADFAGKTVFVEPIATWCPNCRAQQQRVMQVQNQLNTDEIVFISLSVESISDEQLADYARRNGFTQEFVVGTPELLNALVEQFGRSVISAPGTPHFIIAPDGSLSELSLGSKSVDALLQEVQDVRG